MLEKLNMAMNLAYSQLIVAVKINTNMNMEAMVGAFADVILEVAKYTGMVILIIGVVNFFLAMKDDNAEAQSRAIRLAVIGACLAGLKALLTTIGIIS